jgi:hypothetical protein
MTSKSHSRKSKKAKHTHAKKKVVRRRVSRRSHSSSPKRRFARKVVSKAKKPKVVKKAYEPESFPQELQHCWSDLSKGKCPQKRRVVQCYCKGRPSESVKSYRVETKHQAEGRWKEESGSKTISKRKTKAKPKKGLDRNMRMAIYGANRDMVNQMPGGHWTQRLSAFIEKYGADAFGSSGKLKKGSAERRHEESASSASPVSRSEPISTEPETEPEPTSTEAEPESDEDIISRAATPVPPEVEPPRKKSAPRGLVTTLPDDLPDDEEDEEPKAKPKKKKSDDDDDIIFDYAVTE